jgi:hypothetical protein
MKVHKLLRTAHLFATIIVTLSMTPSAFAQKIYMVGVPVCDTIDARFIVNNAIPGECNYPDDYLRFRLNHSLIPYVTGLSFQIVIVETNGRVWSSLSDTVKVGDVLPIPALVDSGVKIFLTVSSSYKFITKIVGTPTVAYENYYCEIKQAQTTAVCKNSYIYFGEGQICQVQPSSSIDDKDEASIPVQFQLLQNYPNPFNAATTIEFHLPYPGRVSLEIFNLHGEKVATLSEREKFIAGAHKLHWLAEGLSSGIYFYQLRTNNFIETRKLILLK